MPLTGCSALHGVNPNQKKEEKITVNNVLLNGQTSKWTNILAGVLQGCVLGPLIFINYINNLPDSLKSIYTLYIYTIYIYIYIYIYACDISTSNNDVNNDLVKIRRWLSNGKCHLILT